jgi:hypothetical protein
MKYKNCKNQHDGICLKGKGNEPFTLMARVRVPLPSPFGPFVVMGIATQACQV